MLDMEHGHSTMWVLNLIYSQQMEIRLTVFDRIRYWFADFQLGEFVGYEEQRVALKGGVHEN